MTTAPARSTTVSRERGGSPRLKILEPHLSEVVSPASVSTRAFTNDTARGHMSGLAGLHGVNDDGDSGIAPAVAKRPDIATGVISQKHVAALDEIEPSVP